MSLPGQGIIVGDDNATFVHYYPPEAWEASAGPYRQGDSYHGTHEASAYVNFTFTGSYVAYYSDMNDDHGQFSAYIDGQLVMQGNSYSPSWVSHSILLFNASVDPGTHTLTLSNSLNGSWIGVDYFLIKLYARRRVLE